jgi:nitrite reductase (NADH) small subunit
MPNHEWKLVARKSEIPVLGARVVSGAHAGPIAIFRTLDDAIFAVLDHCPHKGGPLSQGIVHGQSVTCPMHAWTIGLEDGCAQAPDQGCARSFNVKCVEDDIYLQQAQLVGS